MKNTTEMHFNKHVDQVAGRDIYNMSPPTEELFSRPDDELRELLSLWKRAVRNIVYKRLFSWCNVPFVVSFGLVILEIFYTDVYLLGYRLSLTQLAPVFALSVFLFTYNQNRQARLAFPLNSWIREVNGVLELRKLLRKSGQR
jgi:hypothetical protein